MNKLVGKTNTVLFKIIIMMFILQIIRIFIIKIAFLFIQKTSINNTILNFIIMSIYTIIIILITRKNNKSLSIKENIKSKKIIYLIITFIVLFLIFSTQFFNNEFNKDFIITLIYSTIIIPIFEEILFRGYIWNDLKQYYKKEIIVYIIVTILFSIWHIGYFDSILLNMKINNMTGNILFIMLMKVVTGLIFGIIIGLIRYKTKNTYSGILTHSILNIFGR